jgi:hypothetical protein
VPLKARFRPSQVYGATMALHAGVAAICVLRGGQVSLVLAAVLGVLLVVRGVPLVVSTVCRVPVIVVGDAGVRLPLMGVRLSWSEVAGVRREVKVTGRQQIPLLLVVANDADAVARRAWPWLRSQVRAEIRAHGAPVVLADGSVDRPVEEVAYAIGRYLELAAPKPGPGPVAEAGLDG